MAQSAQVPQARPLQLNDDALDRLISCLEDLERGQLTEEGAAFILICAKPCLEELREHRRRAANSLELEPGTLLHFPGS